MMFTTNGFETYFWDDRTAPQRRVSGIFSKDDLQKLMNRRAERLELMEIPLMTRSPTGIIKKKPSGRCAGRSPRGSANTCW